MRAGVRVLALAGVAACARPTVDRDGLVDPAACASCHPDAYRERAASAHAYASDDPVFRAIVGRGQRTCRS